MGHYVKLIWLLTISILLLGVKEIDPEWKQYQRAEIQERIEKVRESYEFYTDPEMAPSSPEDKKDFLAEGEKRKKELDALMNKKIEIKQILLKGEGPGSNGESGQRVDRCMSCHIDEVKLTEGHPEELPLPYDIYGCTVCHDGNGRALEKERAHEHLLADRKEMVAARKESADKLIEMWKRIKILNPEEKIRLSDSSFYGPTGEYQIYVGNRKCIKCHKKTHPEHVNFWSESKFKTTERIEKEPDFQKGDEDYKKKCYKCHTTGYKEDKGTYEGRGVGCEACHGPGEVYSELMKGEKTIEEARKLTRISFDWIIFSNCHITSRHEMRKEYFEKVR